MSETAVTNFTASIGFEQAYVYICSDHPECGETYHVIAPSALQERRDSGDPEYYFVASHIPEVWDAEWDWEHPQTQSERP